MSTDDLDKLRQDVDNARRALNKSFIEKVNQQANSRTEEDYYMDLELVKVSQQAEAPIQRTAFAAEHYEFDKRFSSSMRQLPNQPAYLVVLCDPVTNAIRHTVIWSSPEWEQSRILDDYVSYVALSVKDTEFSTAQRRLVQTALAHLRYVAIAVSNNIDAQLLASIKLNPGTIRYARLFEYADNSVLTYLALVVTDICEIEPKPVGARFKKLIVSLLPKLQRLFPDAEPIACP